MMLASSFICRDQVMGKLKATRSSQMKVMKRRMTSIVKPCVGAVAEITMQMNFGLVVTYVKGGSMVNV